MNAHDLKLIDDMARSNGSVYCVLDVDNLIVKIGWSMAPAQRLASLQTAHGGRLVLLAQVRGRSQEQERVLHILFKKSHVRGEWFRLTNTIAAYFLKASGVPGVIVNEARKQILATLEEAPAPQVPALQPVVAKAEGSSIANHPIRSGWFEPLVVSPREAMHMLSCSRDRLYEHLNANELDSYCDGRLRKISVQSIKGLVARQLAGTSFAPGLYPKRPKAKSQED